VDGVMGDREKKLSKKIIGALFCLEGFLTVGLVLGFAVYKFFHGG
jgi:hypothetical protein